MHLSKLITFKWQSACVLGMCVPGKNVLWSYPLATPHASPRPVPSPDLSTWELGRNSPFSGTGSLGLSEPSLRSLCLPCFSGRPKQDGDFLCPGLRGRHRQDHQATAAATLRGGGHGGRDGRLPGQSQDVPGGRGQEGEELLLLRPPGLQPRAQLLRCHLDPVGDR